MLPQRLSQGFGSNIGYLPQGYNKVVTRVLFNYWLFVIRLPQCLPHGLVKLLVTCHNVCHKVLIQFVIYHKVVTMFVTRFWSIIGYLSQGCHTVCHNVLVQLLVTCHQVTTMFVTRFWFNYWLFDTQLPQCLSQDFGSIVGHLPQGYHNVCHKLLVQLLVICHKISTMFVTRFYVQLLLLQGYHNACHKVLVRLFGYLPQGFDSIIGHLLHGCHEVLVQLLVI